MLNFNIILFIDFISFNRISNLITKTTALYNYCDWKVPESPAWLVYKGRMADAERALCWLRGWVAPSHVSKELSTLAAHIDKRNVRIVKARDQDYHQVPSQDLGEFANTVGISWYKTGP